VNEASKVLPVITRLLYDTQLQLEAEGYHPPLVRAGIDRARGMAASNARGIRPERYGAAFVDLLAFELARVKDWLDRELEGMTSTSLSRSDK